jgi:hypothetical protein
VQSCEQCGLQFYCSRHAVVWTIWFAVLLQLACSRVNCLVCSSIAVGMQSCELFGLQFYYSRRAVVWTVWFAVLLSCQLHSNCTWTAICSLIVVQNPVRLSRALDLFCLELFQCCSCDVSTARHALHLQFDIRKKERRKNRLFKLNNYATTEIIYLSWKQYDLKRHPDPLSVCRSITRILRRWSSAHKLHIINLRS